MAKEYCCDGDILEFKEGQHFYMECCECGLVHRYEILKVSRLTKKCTFKINRNDSLTEINKKNIAAGRKLSNG